MNISQTIRGAGLGQNSATRTSARKRSFAGGLIFLSLYVDHHDKAYDWAERRRIETHPKTGAAQLVEIRETLQEIVVPTYMEESRHQPVAKPLFAHVSN